MAGDMEPCSTPGCGCSESVFTTSEECPTCGKKLRLSGNLERASFRLVCLHCGYQSALLAQEQVALLL